MLNSNIDAINTLVINCNGELVPFVNKVTLLGVIIDDYLKFDQHTTSICSKVMWKLSVLKKSSYLFDLKFRTILFKLFLQSKFDYCSTILFRTSICNSIRLDKCFIIFLFYLLNFFLFLLVKLWKSLVFVRI